MASYRLRSAVAAPCCQRPQPAPAAGHNHRHSQGRPVSNDIAGILRRMQPRWQRYRDSLRRLLAGRRGRRRQRCRRRSPQRRLDLPGKQAVRLLGRKVLQRFAVKLAQVCPEADRTNQETLMHEMVGCVQSGTVSRVTVPGGSGRGAGAGAGGGGPGGCRKKERETFFKK